MLHVCNIVTLPLMHDNASIYKLLECILEGALSFALLFPPQVFRDSFAKLVQGSLVDDRLSS